MTEHAPSTPAPINGSAFPADLAALLPRARDLADTIGELPSQRRIKAELKIGTEKAKAVLDALSTPAVPALPTAPEPAVDQPEPAPTAEPSTQVPAVASTPAPTVPQPARPVPAWPVLLLALPAFVAIWSGWVGLGELAGFGVVHPLPGIADWMSLNTAITLPVGMETYAAYALRVWLSGTVPAPARRFARWSAIGALVLGSAGQVAYHLMTAAHVTSAPWPVTTAVACLPVAVLGMGAALVHLIRTSRTD